MFRFPVVFRLSALRFSVIRFPSGGRAFLAVGLPARQHRTPTGVTTFRAHEMRSGWVPPVPRGQRCSSRLGTIPSRRLPLLCGQSLYSATTFHRGAQHDETSARGLSSSPVQSASRLWPPDGTGALGLLPDASNPPGTPATHVRPRPGPEHGPGTTPSILVEPPINVFTRMRATSCRSGGCCRRPAPLGRADARGRDGRPL